MIWRETMRETFVDEMIWLKALLGLLRPLFTFNNNRVLLTFLFLFLLLNILVPNSHTLTSTAPAYSIRFKCFFFYKKWCIWWQCRSQQC
jgi:hypothetical protein